MINPPGLIERSVVERTEKRVIVREVWDLSVQGCPMIRDDGMPRARWMRELVFTPQEYEHQFGARE